MHPPTVIGGLQRRLSAYGAHQLRVTITSPSEAFRSAKLLVAKLKPQTKETRPQRQTSFHVPNLYHRKKITSTTTLESICRQVMVTDRLNSLTTHLRATVSSAIRSEVSTLLVPYLLHRLIPIEQNMQKAHDSVTTVTFESCEQRERVVGMSIHGNFLGNQPSSLVSQRFGSTVRCTPRFS